MLNSKQRSALTAQANRLDAVVSLGKGGLSEGVVGQLNAELDRHELIKLRFVNFKETKDELVAELSRKTGAEFVRLIGNVALFYRPNPDPEKRQIVV
jgi:RNA-binding protein